MENTVRRIVAAGSPQSLLLADLEARANRQATPFPREAGPGSVVWHAWGSGPPAVLLHGGAGSWRHWALTIPALEAAGRTIWAPDLPGLGESSPLPEPRDPGTAASILAHGASALLGGAPYDLVGFSFGALVAGLLAAQDETVRMLVLVGPGALGIRRAPIRLESVRGRSEQGRVEAHRTNLARLMFAEPDRIDALALEIQEWNAAHARLVSVGFAEGILLRDALTRVACPVAAIWGERDAVAWPNLPLREEALRAARPDAIVEVVPRAGHWVAYEAAEAFNPLLVDLLDRRMPGRLPNRGDGERNPC